MSVVRRKDMWQCRRCGKWLHRRYRTSHTNGHNRQKQKVVAVLSDLDAGRNRLKPKAKEALQAVTVCAYCKRRGTLDRGPDDLYWHMDHILPWSVEQLERLDNYVKACHSCNIKKGNRTVYPDPDAFTGASKKFRNTELYQKLVEAGKIDPTPVIAPQ